MKPENKVKMLIPFLGLVSDELSQNVCTRQQAIQEETSSPPGLVAQR